MLAKTFILRSECTFLYTCDFSDILSCKLKLEMDMDVAGILVQLPRWLVISELLEGLFPLCLVYWRKLQALRRQLRPGPVLVHYQPVTICLL